MPWTFTIFLLFTCFFLDLWNWVSLGQGSYPKASLQVSPGNVIVRGGNLTFTCTGAYSGVRFVLYKDINALHHQDPPGHEAVFLITDVKQEDEGTYTCHYHTPPSGTLIYSDASDPIQIRVLNVPKPIITLEKWPDVKEDYRINCSAPEDQKVKYFFLYTEESKAPVTDRSAPTGIHRVTFHRNSVTDGTSRFYRCSYQIQIYGVFLLSLLSDPAYTREESDQPTTTRRNQPTSTGKNQPTTTERTPSDNDPTIIISVVCAVLLVIVLIIAAVLYCKRKGKKESSDIQKSALPLSEEVLAAAAELTYTSIAGKEAETIIVPDVEQQNKGEDEELTYATINKEALKKKKKTEAPSSSYEPEETLYAAVKVR